jgi:hypothetical protein
MECNPPIALFFGCRRGQRLGHHLHHPNYKTIHSPEREFPRIPWTQALMDAKLLKNGEHRDIVDGKVFWTCAGIDLKCVWHAFFWWDRSGDSRGNSNSGFYTYGFSYNNQIEAFAFACEQFPAIVKQQQVPLELFNPYQ